MKLFLASEFGHSGDLLKEVYDIPSSASVAYIANAADGEDGRSWMKVNRDKFIQLGFVIEDVDLKDIQGDKLRTKLAEKTAIYVEGGNTFTLMDIARKSSFVEIVRDLVINNNTLYVGTSAGSHAAAPSIDSSKYLDEMDVGPELKNTVGFDLVNFVVIPHIGNDEFFAENEKKYHKLFKHLKDYPYPHICLRDNQAVWVSDGKLEILELNI